AEVEHAVTIAPRSSGDANCTTRASLWIFRTRPLSTVPEPTSTYVVTPSDARRSTTSDQRTGEDTCLTRASIAAHASRFGCASTLAITGTRGVLVARSQFRLESR